MTASKDHCKTPDRRYAAQALPLNDVTASYVNSQGSISRSCAASGSRTGLRQLSLSHAFGLTVLENTGRRLSPPSSPLSGPRRTHSKRASSDERDSSSPCPTCPTSSFIGSFEDEVQSRESSCGDAAADVHDFPKSKGQEEVKDGEEAQASSDTVLSEGRPSKRRRDYNIGIFAPQSRDIALLSHSKTMQSIDRKIPSLFNTPGQQISGYSMLQRRAMGLRAGHHQVSMVPFLKGFASDNWEQVHRFESDGLSDRHWAPPFTVAFSHSAKKGGKKTLAVATEEGYIFMFDAAASKYDAGEKRTSFKAHNNAIFDIAWSGDDSVIATSSGDSCVKLWDVEKQACVGYLSEHACTVRNVVWSPHNPSILATASRDGSIRIWDRRIAGEPLKEIPGANTASVPSGATSVASVNCIRNAHGKGKHVMGRSATKSVTSVAFLQHSSNLLASSGSSDSIIKLWDLRKTHDWRVNPIVVESNSEAVSQMHPVRQHGISKMIVSPDGRKIYAINTNASIHAYDALNLSQKTPLATYRHDEAIGGSFYVHIALSPCSRFLASGNSNGVVYVWDTDGIRTNAVRLRGHEKESTGVDWAGDDMLASCSDDNLVRIWSHSSIDQRSKEMTPNLNRDLSVAY